MHGDRKEGSREKGKVSSWGYHAMGLRNSKSNVTKGFQGASQTGTPFHNGLLVCSEFMS